MKVKFQNKVETVQKRLNIWQKHKDTAAENTILFLDLFGQLSIFSEK